MIFDNINNIKKYLPLIEKLSFALPFFNQQLALTAPGRYELGGEVYAVVIETDQQNKAGLESHQKYIDLHYTIGGIDKIGAKLSPNKFKQQYDEKNDSALYADAPEQVLEVKENQFALFFPGEAHFPLMEEGKVKKVVIKIPYSKCK